MKFEFGWCETCGGAFVYCPKCGNNCCNAGYGDLHGEVCDVCPLAYQYQKLAEETKTEPSKEWIEKHPAERLKLKSWFELEMEERQAYSKMTKEEKLKDIKNNPTHHKHISGNNDLMVCCFIDDKVDEDLMEAHKKYCNCTGESKSILKILEEQEKTKIEKKWQL